MARVACRARTRAGSPDGGAARRQGLALGPRGRLPLAGTILSATSSAGRLVAGEPDRAVAAAAERLQGAVPAEDELVRRDGDAPLLTRTLVRRGSRKAFEWRQKAIHSEPTVTVDAAPFSLHGAMTERDTDIEFDFFEEPETREAARPERPPVRGGPRPPIRTPQGITPLLRLVGLIAFAIVIVLLLVYAVEGCQSSSKHAKYANYMTKVSQIGSNSHSIGTRLRLIARSARREGQRRRRPSSPGLHATSSKTSTPPGRSIRPAASRDEHSRLIDALQYRYSGIVGISDSLRQAVSRKNLAAAQAGALLEAPAQRLLASDVVWDDSFKAPSIQVLTRPG